MRGFRLDDPERCGATLDEALAHAGPALIDAVVDANEPMLPPKRRDTYMKNLSKALNRARRNGATSNGRLSEEPAVTSLRD